MTVATLPILAYHKIAEIPPGARYRGNYVRPDAFARHLRLLRAFGFRSVSFADYLAYRRGEGSLPARPILITFDDGYRSNRDAAWSLLRRFGFRATIFLVTDRLGSTNLWDADEIQEPLLDESEIVGLAEGGIEFQAHTATHARLTVLDDAAALEELRRSRAAIERLTGAPATTISYPWGAQDERVRNLAAAAGFQAGVTERRRMNFDHTPLLALHRIPLSEQTSTRWLAWTLLRLPFRGD